MNSITSKIPSMHSWCNDSAPNNPFTKLFSHIFMAIFDTFQAHIHVSISEKCLVRELSLQQSLSPLDHFFLNTHLIWEPVDGAEECISTHTLVCTKLHRKSACCVFAQGKEIRHLMENKVWFFLAISSHASTHFITSDLKCIIVNSTEVRL